MTLRSAIALLLAAPLLALERPGVEFKIFQFPADRIPTIDGKTNDWHVVPESYVIGTDQLKETAKGLGVKYDKNDLDVRVRVGWVRGLNRLYFLYEAFDDYWKFEPVIRQYCGCRHILKPQRARSGDEDRLIRGFRRFFRRLRPLAEMDIAYQAPDEFWTHGSNGNTMLRSSSDAWRSEPQNGSGSPFGSSR
jgi:hypothetical protein